MHCPPFVALHDVKRTCPRRLWPRRSDCKKILSSSRQQTSDGTAGNAASKHPTPPHTQGLRAPMCHAEILLRLHQQDGLRLGSASEPRLAQSTRSSTTSQPSQPLCKGTSKGSHGHHRRQPNSGWAEHAQAAAHATRQGKHHHQPLLVWSLPPATRPRPGARHTPSREQWLAEAGPATEVTCGGVV